MGRRCLAGADVSWLPTLRCGQNDWRVLLGSLSALYVAGSEVDWSSFDRDYPRRRLSLPTYPFERQLEADEFTCWGLVTRWQR